MTRWMINRACSIYRIMWFQTINFAMFRSCICHPHTTFSTAFIFGVESGNWNDIVAPIPACMSLTHSTRSQFINMFEGCEVKVRPQFILNRTNTYIEGAATHLLNEGTNEQKWRPERSVNHGKITLEKWNVPQFSSNAWQSIIWNWGWQ